MFPAITLRNLPSDITLPFLEKVLSGNHISWKHILICDSNDENRPGREAHVQLNGKQEIKQAIRVLNQCEVAGCILEVSKASPDVFDRLKDTPDSVEPLIDSEPPDNGELVDIIETENLDSPVDSVEEEIDRVPFSTLGLSQPVLDNLERLEFKTTTPIQALAIPPAMEGCDLIGRAQTGTGKTLAFTIPIVEQLLAKPGKGVRALVVAPTRELAIQIKEVVEEIIEGTNLKTVVVYGGDNILDQMILLREGVDILIATPGRLLDLQGRGRLRFDAADIFVLDEADRMLDMGFLPDIKTIFSCFYGHPQTMLFSATIPMELNKLTGVNLRDPVFVDAGAPDLTPLDTVSQKVLYVSPSEKDQFLYDLLDREPGPVLIFTRTKRATESLARRIRSAGYLATRIHGDISQSDRLIAVEAFRSGKYKILVATDVASRGLDIEGIAHVVNYDLPRAPEDHLHRIGRTARAGATGKATTFVTHEERRKTMRHFKQVLGQS